MARVRAFRVRAAVLSLVIAPAFGDCGLVHWPGVQPEWGHSGSSEKCFCAYAMATTYPDRGISILDEDCPGWRKYVSTDLSAWDKLVSFGAATIQGKLSGGNATSGKYASMTDWAVDLGSGYGRDCDPASSPGCESTGAHVLSIPRAAYVSSCCDAGPNSFASLLLAGGGAPLCATLADMIVGGSASAGLQAPACAVTNTEANVENQCSTQCLHIKPDVFFLHLHTTIGVKDVRREAIDSGLGPDYNASEADHLGGGYYNVCVCEPNDWQAFGRGHCPKLHPKNAGYAAEAAEALCRNIVATAGLAQSLCDVCRGPQVD
ncbi:hypothetical protein M885DRAFT_552212 [Pelagophyceae sp. CCMP2097]|nr:hypothetical protein M885DRAFT_552212 [Pelagophyceae sp. CCMP2097]